MQDSFKAANVEGPGLFGQAGKELMCQLEFLDGLVAMREEFYEIEGEVMRVADLALKSLVAWHFDNRIELPPENTVIVVLALMEFVYLMDHPRRWTLSSVSAVGLKELMHTKKAPPDVRKELQSKAGCDFLGKLFFMLAELGYPNAHKKARVIEEIKKRLEGPAVMPQRETNI